MLALLLFPLVAPAAHDPARLSDLVESQRFEEAFELARAQQAEHAGEPRFDFYYGLAAIETGRVAEGVFALERVLIRQPGLDRARLEYARGLYLQGDDRKAQRQFETVLAGDPPPLVVDRVERYLAALERRADRYRTTVTGHIGARLGYDDNVNRAPATESVDLGFGTLQLDDDDQERDAAFLGVNGRVDISRPLVPGLNVVGSLNGDTRRHDGESEFDTTRGGGRLGLRWTSGPHRLAGFLEGDRLYLDGDGYQEAGGLSLDYRYRLDDRTALSGTARWTRLRYDELELLDSTLAWLGGGVTRAWRGLWNPRGQAMLLFGAERAEDSSQRARALAERDLLELRGVLSLSPAPNWTLTTTLRWRDSEYDSNTFPFSEAREEDYFRLDVGLTWQPSVRWRVGPFVTYSENDANIELYDYEQSVVGLEARYTFF